MFKKELFSKVTTICISIYFFSTAAMYSAYALRVNSIFDNINSQEDIKRRQDLSSAIQIKELFAEFNNELNILMNVQESKLTKVVGEKKI